MNGKDINKILKLVLNAKAESGNNIQLNYRRYKNEKIHREFERDFSISF